MATDARIRIDEHRLVRDSTRPAHDVRIEDRRALLDEHHRAGQRSLRMRSVLHVAIFGIAFIFTTGALVLSILLWVRPDRLLLFLVVGLAAGFIFVTSFAALRFLSLVHLFPDAHARETGEEEHHLTKSIAYGFVALIFAVLLAGLLINRATAFTL